ncbi:sensor histidine kinase [Aliivibrio fischeri]|uniref:sensor histidine kinase n=1 Tax=Aliivibrio fischeri TaxID=668 RepID=UPI0009081829|nr:sensor histidine kinase [Aliivibrio fischeri]
MKQYDVGVLALRGHYHCNIAWEPTMKWLESQIPNSKFVLHSYNFDGLENAFQNDELDFLLTSPGQATTFARRLPINWLATQKKGHELPLSKAIASSVIVRADSPYHSLQDIEYAKIAAVSEKAFGGFIAFHFEMDKLGYFNSSFFDRIQFTGPPTDNLIRSVENGELDVAIAPACTLEEMVEEGFIDRSDFRVLGQQEHDGFTCAVSTPLYPNWTFAKTDRASNEIGKKVTQALLAMPANAFAAESANNVGWTLPESSLNVDKVYQHFDMHPLQKPWTQQMEDWLHRNPYLALMLIAGLFGLNIYHVLLELRFKRSKKVLRKTLEDLREKSTMLEHAQRIMIVGELGSSLAHEINQPLSAIKNYSQGVKLRIEKGNKSEELLPVMEKIQQQVTVASDIIQRLRDLINKKPIEKRRFWLGTLVNDTYRLIEHDFQRNNIAIEINSNGEPNMVSADYTGLQQLLLNLLNNAKDACIKMGKITDPLVVRIELIYLPDQVRIMIIDNGIGIEDETTPLEQAFYTTKKDGLGLGLAICRDVIENHDGMMKYSSVKPRGCCVEVILPYQKG